MRDPESCPAAMAALLPEAEILKATPERSFNLGDQGRLANTQLFFFIDAITRFAVRKA